MIAPLHSRGAPSVPPLKIYRYFLRGMEQQMWFFGQDARHGGNLLRRYGFESFRSSQQGSNDWRRRCCMPVAQ